MVNRKGKREGTLVYLASLPEDEPAYRDGYSCDTCQREYVSGPLFHCKTSGEDRCLECAVRTRIWHPLPETVREAFFARDLRRAFDDASVSALGTASPVAAFRTTTSNVFVLLYNGTCLHVNVGASALISGFLRDGATGAVGGPIDGLQLVEKFPFLEMWCNAEELNDPTLFNKTTFGSLPTASLTDHHSSKAPLFVTCFSLYRETLSIGLSNGVVQALHKNGRGGLWHCENGSFGIQGRHLTLYRAAPTGATDTEQDQDQWCADVFEGLRDYRVGAK